MTVNDLIQRLSTMDPSATVITLVYCGGNHDLIEVQDVTAYGIGQSLVGICWDGVSDVDAVNCAGVCIKPVVII